MGQNIGELVKKYEAVKKQSKKYDSEFLALLAHYVFSAGGR
jgi:hypothetical protein